MINMSKCNTNSQAYGFSGRTAAMPSAAVTIISLLTAVITSSHLCLGQLTTTTTTTTSTTTTTTTTTEAPVPKVKVLEFTYPPILEKVLS